MADPLSTTASIIAIIQLLSAVGKYINEVGGATKEKKRLRDEVRTCEFILRQLKDDADDTEEGKAASEIIKTLEGPDAPLGRLNVSLRVLKAKLEPQAGLQKTLASLKWPFNEKEVEKIISAIECEKALLHLALTNDSRKLIHEIRIRSNENKTRLAEFMRLFEDRSSETDRQLTKLLQTLDISSTESMQQFEEVKSGIEILQQAEDNEQRQAILDWLTPIKHAVQQQDVIRRRQEGTGQWFLQSKEFEDWLNMDNHTLFCPGMPGAGKTTLTSIVVEELFTRFKDNRDIGIAYLYCNYQRRDEQNLEDMIGSLLQQLVQEQTSIPESVKSLYVSHQGKGTRPLLHDLLQTIQSVVAIYSRVIIIVDALDECNSSHGFRQTFLSNIFDLQVKCNAKFCATSRSIASIENTFEGSLKLEIRASEEDVRRYLEGHMIQLPNFVTKSLDLQEEIKTSIVDAVDGMFLLAQLHLDSLNGSMTLKAIRAACKNLATGSEAYDNAYRDAMDRINSQNKGQKELAKRVLSWIVCAYEQITITELQHAIAVETGESKLDEENFTQIEDLLSVCAGLVTIDEESEIIRLVHHTTREYFEREWSRWFPDAQSYITTTCVTYLSFDKFGSEICLKKEFDQRLQSNVLYSYAARNWGHHAREASSSCGDIMNFLGKQTHVDASFQGLVYSKYSSRLTSLKNTNGLHLAAYFGIVCIVQLLLDENVDVNVTNDEQLTPLHFASENGHVKVVRLLLDNGADVNAANDDQHTPLHIASINDYIEVVRLLLDNGADVNTANANKWTALHLASYYGHLKVVRLLLDNGADVNTANANKWTALHLASYYGHLKVVRLLLDNGADVNTANANKWTALHLASYYGHLEVVRLLLDNGADFTMADKYMDTALHLASHNGHIKVVRLLLNKGADVNIKNEDNRTALDLASKWGYPEIVELLRSARAVI